MSKLSATVFEVFTLAVTSLTLFPEYKNQLPYLYKAYFPQIFPPDPENTAASAETH